MNLFYASDPDLLKSNQVLFFLKGDYDYICSQSKVHSFKKNTVFSAPYKKSFNDLFNIHYNNGCPKKLFIVERLIVYCMNCTSFL